MRLNHKMLRLSVTRQIRRIALLQGVMAIFLSICSCVNESSQVKYFSLEKSGWMSSDTLHLSIDSLSESGKYEFMLAVRTSSAVRYPFRDLVLEVNREWERQAKHQIDTVTFILAKKDGELTGSGIAIYSYEFPVDILDLEAGDRGIVHIRHLMRRSPLEGVYHVGFLLKKK